MPGVDHERREHGGRSEQVGMAGRADDAGRESECREELLAKWGQVTECGGSLVEEWRGRHSEAPLAGEKVDVLQRVGRTDFACGREGPLD